MVRGLETPISHNSNEHKNGEFGIGSPSLGLNPQSVVEVPHGHSPNILRSSGDFEQARRPLVMPHFDESRWIIQERKSVDFRGVALAHMGNHPSLKLLQILEPVQICDLLLCCKENIMRILKYMVIWKPDLVTSKDLLRRLGWSMVEVAMMNPNPVKVSLGEYVKMNILMWNCKGALNPDFKRRVFEMAVNHNPSIMVITETRVGGDRAEKIIAEFSFDGYIIIETIGDVGGLWVLWKKEEAEVILLASTEQEIHATVKVRHFDLSWFISTIYAGPRLANKRIL